VVVHSEIIMILIHTSHVPHPNHLVVRTVVLVVVPISIMVVVPSLIGRIIMILLPMILFTLEIINVIILDFQPLGGIHIRNTGQG
jgi:hypothetical protein